MIRKYSVLIGTISSFLFFSSLVGKEPHRLGCLKEDPRTIDWMQQAVFRAKVFLPSAVDLSPFMPPVKSQGYQGSCVAWATGYYFKTFQEWYEHKWNLSNLDHQFSPAFMYNQINGGVDAGAYTSDGFKLLCDFGCASLTDCPYDYTDSTSWPSESAYENGIPFRCENLYWIDCSNSTGLNRIKQLLADTGLAVTGISVWSNFDNINNFDTVYCVADTYGTIRGGHAVTFVGYDDDKPTNDGVGAFRMVNSWGTGWGNQGYWWMSYEATMSSDICHGYAYYSTDKIGYSPSVRTRYKINHPTRERITIRMGIGPSTSPDWTKNFFDWWMSAQADWPFPPHNIVLDISDGDLHLDPGSANNIFIRCTDALTDGKTGTIEHLSAEHITWGTSSTSTETPKSIPDDDNPVYVNLTIGSADTCDIYVTPDTLVFTDSILTVDTAKTTVVHNTGNTNLNVTSITGSESWVASISPTLFTVTPGDSQNVTVIVTKNGLANGTYYTNLSIYSNDPDENPYIEPVKFIVADGLGVEEGKEVPDGFRLFPPTPNPFREQVSIRYGLPKNLKVEITIYNLSGQKITTLVNKNKKAGYHSIRWNGEDKFGKKVVNGIYFYCLQAGEFKATKKFIILR